MMWMWLLLALVTTQAHAISMFASDIEVYSQAKQAYQSRQLGALQSGIELLKQRRSPLLPYLQYWQLILNVDQTTYPHIQVFLAENNDNLLGQRVRELWLKKLGRSQQWEAFLQMRAQMPPEEALTDLSNQCFEIQANIAQAVPDAYAAAKALLATGKDWNSDCQGMLDELQKVDVLDEARLLSLFRDAMFANKPLQAKQFAKRSAMVEPGFFKQVDEVVQNPALALKHHTIKERGPYGRALMAYVIQRQARADISLAQHTLQQFQSYFHADERPYLQAAIALEAARKLLPEALSLFQSIDADVLNAEQWEWYARTALRQQAWSQVRSIITQMPKALADEPTWRYWLARALKEAGETVEANALFASLSQARHFYGWLAEEELGQVIGEPTALYQPSAEEVKQFAKLASIQRIEALFDGELRYEARLEWLYLIEHLDDQTRIVAAQYAIGKSWFDLAVLAADKTNRVHNFALRYPTPYRAYLQKAARDKDIDEAWVYGIIRQESRFMHYAKSSVGAGGLMQVMPATAKWIAKKLAWNSYHDGMLHDIDTNVHLGTYYMRFTLDTFNGQEAMATAAYNAGPSRARKWAANVPLEGAIYAETIPFAETRNYVKKVLANAHMYAPRLGLPTMSLRKRLGVIPAKAGVEYVADPVKITEPE